MSEPFGQYPHGQYSYGPGGAYPVPEPPRRHRARHALGLTATAVVAAALGAGAAVGLAGGSSGGAGAAATSTSGLSTSQIASKIDPGLVDVTSTLGYQQATAKGTGIVLTSNGEILTNNHVINGATSVSVTDIGNGKTYKATVVGYDESKDVAVLQLTGASGLTVANLGDSNTVGVGNSVVALGNAEGLGGTPSVATGSVTALDQSITASDESSATSEPPPSFSYSLLSRPPFPSAVLRIRAGRPCHTPTAGARCNQCCRAGRRRRMPRRSRMPSPGSWRCGSSAPGCMRASLPGPMAVRADGAILCADHPVTSLGGCR